MNSPVTFEGTFCLHAALTLLHFLWQGLLLAMIACLAGWALRNRSASFRYRMYAATMLLMLACLPATFVLLHQRQVLPTSALVVSDAATPTSVVAVERGDVPTRVPVATVPLSRWATVAYVVGVCLMFARMFLSVSATRRLRRDAQPLTETESLDMIGRRARQFGLRQVPVVAYCSRVAVPALVGLWRPMILLPTVLATGLTPAQLELVIVHELAHIRRWDNAWLLAQRVTESILFFHPAVWYVSRRLSIERELCCDEMVVAMVARSDYADSLLRVAELTAVSTMAVPAGATMTSPREGSAVFVHRLMLILGESKLSPVRLLRTWPTLTVGFLAIAAICLAGWLWNTRLGKAATAHEISLARSMVSQELLRVHWQGLETFDSSEWKRQADILMRDFSGRLQQNPRFFSPAKADGPLPDSVEEMLLAEFASDEDEIYHRTSDGTLRYMQRVRAKRICVSSCHAIQGVVFDPAFRPQSGDRLKVGDVIAVVSVEVRPDQAPLPRAVR
jgi:beta-lactamase regulating signal transducer with metallopeptidase domain